ncbi:MAG: hypothetical protein ABH837_02635 [bacterium]
MAYQKEKKLGEIELPIKETVERKVEIKPGKVEMETEKIPFAKELPTSPTITSPTGGKTKGGPKKKAGITARAEPSPTPPQPKPGEPAVSPSSPPPPPQPKAGEPAVSPFEKKPVLPEEVAGEKPKEREEPKKEPKKEERKEETPEKEESSDEGEAGERGREVKKEQPEEQKPKEDEEDKEEKKDGEEEPEKKDEKEKEPEEEPGEEKGGPREEKETKPGEEEPVGGKVKKPKAGTSKGVGAAEGTADKGAAGAARAGAAGGARTATGVGAKLGTALARLGPWGWAALAVIIVVVVILICAAVGCSDRFGSSLHQPDDGSEGRYTRAYAGDNNAQAEVIAVEGSEFKDSISIISDQEGSDNLQPLSDETVNIIDSLMGLNPDQEQSRENMIEQVSQNYQSILDHLGIYIVGLPGHLENINQRQIDNITVNIAERRIYLHSSANKDKDLILGSAPVYFAYDALNNIQGATLPSGTTKIKKIQDAGEGNHFIDKNGYDFGRYYIELDGKPEFIIGANTKDEELNTDNYSLSMLRATSGPLRVSSSDLENLAKYLLKHSNHNIKISFINE